MWDTLANVDDTFRIFNSLLRDDVVLGQELVASDSRSCMDTHGFLALLRAKQLHSRRQRVQDVDFEKI